MVSKEVCFDPVNVRLGECGNVNGDISMLYIRPIKGLEHGRDKLTGLQQLEVTSALWALRPPLHCPRKRTNLH